MLKTHSYMTFQRIRTYEIEHHSDDVGVKFVTGSAPMESTLDSMGAESVRKRAATISLEAH